MLWYFFFLTRSLNLPSVLIEVLAPPFKGTTGLVDSLEIAQVTFQNQRLPRGQIIQEPAPAHHVVQFLVGQTLVEHRQVVAEVQERLHRIRLRQRAATHMIDVAFGQTVELAATNAQTPAEVYLLVVGKESAVQSATVPIVLPSDHQRSTRCPQNLRSIIILPVVVLYRVEDASTTERIAIAVKVSPTRPGILELILIIYREQLRLTGSHLRMHVHKLYHRRQPVVRHLDVRVQQQVVFGINLLQGLVIAVGKAPVLVQHDELALRELPPEQFQRLVGGRIIGHIYRRLVARIVQHGRQILSEHLGPVPVQYDNCYLIHFNAVLS